MTRNPLLRVRLIALVAALAIGLTGCSVKKFAINKLGDSLAKSGTTFAGDEDPELIGQALPFSLKLIESLLAESPKHRGLLFAASSGFTQYAYVFVQQDAERLESENLTQSNEMKVRARKLYIRARDYGLRGLDVKHPNFSSSVSEDPKHAVRALTKADVPLTYWTAASWGAAISLSKDNPDLIADQTVMEVLMDRAYELDPDFDYGAIDSFLITYESARQGAKGDFAERSRQHFDRAVRLTEGKMASPYVSLAETVCIAKQDRPGFESLLNKALAIDPGARPEWRLSNVVMQRRARWLLSRVDELFVGDAPAQESRVRSYPIYVNASW
jgi:predicted anti-sigma-YlaC factor YlaD